MQRLLLATLAIIVSFILPAQTKVADIVIPDGDIFGEPVFLVDTVNENVLYSFYLNESKIVVSKGDSTFKFDKTLKATYPSDKEGVPYDNLICHSFSFNSKKAFFLLKSSQDYSLCLVTFDFQNQEVGFKVYDFKDKKILFLGASIVQTNIQALYVDGDGVQLYLFKLKDNGEYLTETLECKNDFFDGYIGKPLIGNAHIKSRINDAETVSQSTNLIPYFKLYFTGENIFVLKNGNKAETSILEISPYTKSMVIKVFRNENTPCKLSKGTEASACYYENKVFQVVVCYDAVAVNIFNATDTKLLSQVVCAVNNIKTQCFNYIANGQERTMTRTRAPFIEDIIVASEIISKLNTGYPFIYISHIKPENVIVTVGSFSVEKYIILNNGAVSIPERINIVINSKFSSSNLLHVQEDIENAELKIGDAEIPVLKKTKAKSIVRLNETIYYGFYPKRNKGIFTIIK
jgi:hypothetical protein